MRQSGDYTAAAPLSPDALREMLLEAVRNLDVEKAREEVLPFLSERRSVAVWSADFHASLIEKVEFV